MACIIVSMQDKGFVGLDSEHRQHIPDRFSKQASHGIYHGVRFVLVHIIIPTIQQLYVHQGSGSLEDGKQASQRAATPRRRPFRPDNLTIPGSNDRMDLVVEACNWDPEVGFVHQIFCRHKCHSSPTGFGHILICCGREVLTDDIACSERCQRPYDRKCLSRNVPDCPNCGPWSAEAGLLNLLEGVEWWFHFLDMLPRSREVEHHQQQLRIYLAGLLGRMDPKWQTYLTLKNDSVRLLRAGLLGACERQKESMLARQGLSINCVQKPRPLPISDDEAEKWYARRENETMNHEEGFALDDFIQYRAGALDFFTIGDDAAELRADMIEHIRYGITQFGWPPENEKNNRRLLALFDRELFRDHIFDVGSERLHDLVESDKQLTLFKGEQVIQRSQGYWQDLEDLAGTAEVYDLSHAELMYAFDNLIRSSKVMNSVEPIFSWLELCDSRRARFKVHPDKSWVSGLSLTALDFLRHFESPERFGCMLMWSPCLIAGFLSIADRLQYSRFGRRPDWAAVERDVEALRGHLIRRAVARAEI